MVLNSRSCLPQFSRTHPFDGARRKPFRPSLKLFVQSVQRCRRKKRQQAALEPYTIEFSGLLFVPSESRKVHRDGEGREEGRKRRIVGNVE